MDLFRELRGLVRDGLARGIERGAAQVLAITILAFGALGAQAQTTTSIALTANPNPAIVNASVTLTATVTPSSATGSVNFRSETGNLNLGTGTLSGGVASITTSYAAANVKSISATYSGNGTYAGSTTYIDQRVNASSATVNTTTGLAVSSTTSSPGQTVTFTATVAGTAPTGQVHFREGITELGSGTVSTSGNTLTATFATSSLGAGSHIVRAVYYGDSTNKSSVSGTVTETVSSTTPTSTTIGSSLNPSKVGQSVTFTANVTGSSPAGTVNFMNGSTQLGSGTLSAGQATYATAALTAASSPYSVTAVYVGQGANAGSTSATPVVQVVNKWPTATAISVAPSSASAGQTVTFTATITGGSSPSGAVTFMEGATTLGTASVTGGVATYSTSTLTGGTTHNVNATYNGDAGNTTSSTSTPASVIISSGPTATSTSLTTSANPASVNQSLTFTVSVVGSTPTGTVTFKDGTATLTSKALSAGQATYTTTALAVGSHPITAVYGGDAGNLTSTSAVLTQAVNQTAGTATTTTLQISPSAPAPGATVTLTGHVPDGNTVNAGATMTFFDGAVALGSAAMSNRDGVFTTSFAAGSHSLKAVYSGNSGNASSTSAVTPLNVTGPSTTTVSSSSSTAAFGSPVTFTVTVTGSNPTGTVTFTDTTTGTSLGTPSLAGTGNSRTASVVTSGLTVTTHTITASYAGDTANATSTGTTTQTITKAATTAALAASPGTSSTYGQTVTFTATVVGINPSGAVTFTADGTTPLGTINLTGTGNSRTAQVSTSTLAAGAAHSIVASYAGDANNAASTANLSQTVAASNTTTSLTSSPQPSSYGQSVTFTATVSAASGATGTVTFKEGATTLGTGPLSAGQATWSSSSLSGGSHNVTANYGGDANNGPSSGTWTHGVNSIASTTSLSLGGSTSTYGDTVTLTATVAGAGATGAVTFRDGAVTLGNSSLNGAGVATLSVSTLGAVAHSLTADYAGDTNYTASTSGAAALTVNPQATAGTVTANPNPSPLGQALTITLNVTGANVGGSATFSDNATPLGTAAVTNGVANYVTSQLALGAHSLSAVYTPDANHTSSSAPAVAHTISQAVDALSVTASPAAPTIGESVTLRASVSGVNPSGTVSFTEGTSLGTAPIVGSVATLNLGPLALGTHTIVASYAGDTSNAGATNTIVLTVNARTGYTWQYGYDAMGRTQTVVDPNGQASQIVYDGLGRARQTQQPANTGASLPTLINLDYDSNDVLTTVTDPRSLLTTYGADGLGNIKTQTSPDTGTSNYLYYDNGNLKSVSDARSKLTSYSYDALDRLKTISYTTGTGVTFDYDGGATPTPQEAGELTKITDESGSTSYAHDALGRLTGKTVAIGSKTFTVGYAWGDSGSALDKLTAITYPSGARVNYSYDAKGNVSGVTVNPAAVGGGTGGTTTTLLSGVTYNVDNALSGWLWSDGKARTIGYDNAGLVTSYTLGDPNGTSTKAGALRTVVRDAAGRISGYTHTNNGTATTALDQGFAYDNLDRLTSDTVGATSTIYSYDATGNRTSKQVGATTYTNTVSATSNRYTQTQDASTGTVTPIYDTAGHLTNDGTYAFTYSDRGRMSSALIGANTVSYLYNGLNQRVKKSGPTAVVPTGAGYFVYDEAGQLLGEYDASGAPLYETAYLGSTPVGVVKTAGIYNMYADQIDAPRMITQQDHTIVWRWDTAEAFGANDPTSSSGFVFNQRFPGQVFDAETGLFQNWNREYNARLGRYIESDPIGLRGGINTFLYARGSALSLTDRNGLQPVPSGMYLPRGPAITAPPAMSTNNGIATTQSIMQQFTNMPNPSQNLPGDYVGINFPWRAEDLPFIPPPGKPYCVVTCGAVDTGNACKVPLGLPAPNMSTASGQQCTSVCYDHVIGPR